MTRAIALALQGMAIWHLLLGVCALALTLGIVAAQPSGDSDTLLGVGAVTGAEVTGGAAAAVLILGGISWAMQERAFWRPRWSIILIPGLAGTLATGLFELQDWPASYLVGGFLAYWLVTVLLTQESPPDSADNQA
jgi:hypothetical protein